ncbi:helix-turn-helix transcriptional regulator [Hydrogenophaga sp. 5NK40-0174]|uniref:AraC family transcriptional regulator n=1 Tax=Hydrogenophaga sp. 5NK40-0174 TaxID=3127649 RepID=UPI00310545D8
MPIAPSVGHFARIVATRKHRVSTVCIHQDSLIVVRRGRKTLLRTEGALEAVPGEALAVARGTVWDVINDPATHGSYEADVLVFGEDLIASGESLPLDATEGSTPLSGGSRIKVDGTFGESIDRVVGQLRHRTVSDQVLAHWLQEVLIHLREGGIRFTPVADLSWTEQVRRRVSQTPDGHWTLEALAERFHMSASTLQRRLAEEGHTVAALVRQFRLELALGMLQTTDLPIGEVAQRCGWQSHSRFSAAFQDRWGFSPSQLRREAVNGSAQNLTGKG